MTARGDIHSSAYAGRAKEYMWSTLSDVFPRNVTPSDIDGAVELNHCFFLFEGKTEGATIPDGQRIFLHRLLLALPRHRAVLVVCTHPRLEVVNLAAEPELKVEWRWVVGNTIRKSAVFPNVLRPLCELFVAEAERIGRLGPASWERKLP